MRTSPRPDTVTHRTVVIGDSHGSRPMLREALRVAAMLQADRLVSVGDFGIWPGTGGKAFLDVCETMAAARDIDVLVVPGNHDDYDQLAAAGVDDDGLMVVRDRLRAAPRGHVARLGRARWLLCGGAASIDGPGGIWPQNRGPATERIDGTDRTGRLRTYPAGHDLGGWWPQERITDADVRACHDAAADGTVDVLVTHEAPSEVGLSGSHKPVTPGEWTLGDEQRERVSAIRAAARPPVQLCGHWHQHTVHRDDLGTVVVLSADVVPAQRQWVVVDDEAGDVPVVRMARVWDSAVALTDRRRGNHQVVSDLSDADLVELPVIG